MMVGILSSAMRIFGGAGEGYAKAVGENADSNMKRTLEMQKEEALAKRQENLARLTHELQAGENQKTRDFQKGENEASRTHDASMEDRRERFTLDREAERNRSEDARLDKEIQSRKDLLSEEYKQRGILAGEERKYKDQEKTEMERQYDFLSRILGEDKAKQHISDSKSAKNVLEKEKAAANTYNDIIKSYSGESLDGVTPEIKEEANRIVHGLFGVDVLGTLSGNKNQGQPGHGSPTLDELKPLARDRAIAKANASSSAGEKQQEQGSGQDTKAVKEEATPVNQHASLGEMNSGEMKDSYKTGILAMAEPGTTPASLVRKLSNFAGAGNINKRDPMTTDMRSGEDEIIRALRLSGVEPEYEKAVLIKETLKAKYPNATDDQIAELILKSGKRIKR